MVDAEDARGCTALHYACRKLTKSEDFTSAEDIDLIKEGAEEARRNSVSHSTYYALRPARDTIVAP